jgi:diadenosine tetraphosphatase ApaH/serine/threonine PP2A family protein phosphatase
MARALVIGDVHGCSAELEALLAVVHDAEREVVFVGDLVAKGPDSRGVVRRARELGARAVMGNHDLKVIRAAMALRRGETPEASAGHRRAAESLGDEDVDWLAALPYALRLEEHGAIVVHAGLVPGVALGEQSERDLVTMRSVTKKGEASSRIEDGVPWASLWKGPELVLFGHDAVRGLQEHPHAIGLDTGCVYGGRLTGLLLPERELVSVPAERAWAAAGAGG